MKTMALVLSAALLTAGAACSRDLNEGTARAEQAPAAQKAAAPRDNTALNVRDRGGDTLTAQDQSEHAADRTVTQEIRKAIVADDSLSTDAKNVKVITVDGVVTLRGPVASDQERNKVAAKVNGIASVKRVDNQLEVTAR
jgi:hyperosmotically inducible protein